jgi:DNA-binding response OmpR family regulator
MGTRKLKVGVVDDNRSVAEIITEILGGRDFVCYDAYDGRGAVELCRTHDLDLLILDYLLPDFDGLEVVRRIEASGKGVATLIITAAGKDPPGGWGFSSLVRGVVRKPFTGSELRAKVSEVTGRELP